MLTAREQILRNQRRIGIDSTPQKENKRKGACFLEDAPQETNKENNASTADTRKGRAKKSEKPQAGRGLRVRGKEHPSKRVSFDLGRASTSPSNGGESSDDDFDNPSETKGRKGGVHRNAESKTDDPFDFF